MLTVDEAFRKFKSRLELNEKEQKNASNRHKEVRDYLATKFKIDRGRRPSGMLAPPTLEIPNVLVPDLPRLPDHVSDGSISDRRPPLLAVGRSEEHTSELQSLMRISYAVFCLKNKKTQLPINPIP